MALSSDLVQDMKTVTGKLNDVSDQLDGLEKRAFREWLVRTNPSANHNTACSIYEPETGMWVQRLPEWKEWLNTTGRSCLWIHGIPGAGKTVLFSHLVTLTEHHCRTLDTPRITSVYYYCNHERSHDEASPFLRWLLGQLSNKSNAIPEEIYTLHRGGIEPSLPQLLLCLEQILDCFDVVFVCLDAIDESLPRQELLRVIRDLSTDSRFSKIRLLATSREYLDIERTMHPISTSVSMSNSFVEQDIRIHVSKFLDRSSDIPFKYWDQTLKTEVTTALAEGAQGMFRWAVCQLDLMCRAKLTSPEKIHFALKTLPKTLDETYERIFAAIPDEDQELLRKALCLITFHSETLQQYGDKTPLEVLICLLWGCNLSDFELRTEWLQEIGGCLVRVTKGWSKKAIFVSFAHYTVREYLTSSRILQSHVRYFCLNPLAIVKVLLPVVLKDIPEEAILGENGCHLTPLSRGYFSLVAYSLCFNLKTSSWEEIIQNEKVLWMILLDFFKRPKVRELLGESPIFIGEFQWWAMTERHSDELDSDAVVLLRLVLSGLHTAAEWFLKDKDIETIFQQQVLISVPWKGQLEGKILDVFLEFLARGWVKCDISFLIRKGAGFFDPSPALVSYTRFHWWEAVDPSNSITCSLDILLSQGADTNWTGYVVTALQLAVARKDYGAVKRLLKAGADPNLVGDISAPLPEDEKEREECRKLRGRSPLCILRQQAQSQTDGPWPRGRFMRVHGEVIGKERSEIKNLLRKAGAKSFVKL
ncbi:Vegetative incompatibility protein HET-E-1 [Fusarium austroafricanum]|uniref:Vegetative incompatibility protein HET-E-1 n=1 Tax=Fusarium austroafricanum TaxID=2364996 RepID=A0A8H4KJG9_9HYPO|nr:Vegetative incompatibility protein HET-E-1 [Fusarium austroafricanum]